MAKPTLTFVARCIIKQWRSVVDLTTHAISGLCLDDVIVLSLRWYDILRVPMQF